jgi:chemotaxis protein methyltransferase WspC
MNLAPILTAVQERTGLDPSTLGTHAVQAAVGERLRALGLTEPEYATRIGGDAAEFSRLVSDVIVPETWLFRGGEVFGYLAEQARAAPLGRPFRALSLPCSTGEEPYSLAIALAEAGVPASRCAIDGVDLSPRAVEAARAGVYSDLSFRQTSAELRRRYFRPLPRGGEIDPEIRARVRFQVGNLLDRAVLLWEKPYDLVFCRNLFIYFTPEARRRGLDTLARLVAPGGLLVVGHAEALPATETRFERVSPPAFFLYRRTQGAAP